MRNKIVASAALAMALFGVTACSGGSDDDSTTEPTATSASTATESASPGAAPEALEPDLESIPDVVAVVNGEEITRDEFIEVYESQFGQMAAQAQMAGQPVDEPALKQQTAERLVETELLLQEAANRGLDTSDEERSATLDEIALSSGMEGGDAFVAAMVEQGMTEEEVMEQVDIQVRIEKLIADEAGDTTPTDEEVQAAYDAVVAQQEAAGAASGETAPAVPPLDEVRPQVEDQVRSEKESTAVAALLEGLRESGDITINLT
ncbi:SurA N-terminal domain-containing protein [Georgenia sp. MJ206]|uniref:SurA N-terminal domain-containing protein n=1 Tax=Georgenia wangjunii TaxID=3117730 RepID=UPI002F26CD6E